MQSGRQIPSPWLSRLLKQNILLFYFNGLGSWDLELIFLKKQKSILQN
jgi:hypothetical protein